jgi:hypothetical protein
MSDNLQNRGPRDRSRINVNEEWEVRYWTDKFGIGAYDLKRIVEEVGDRVEDVKKRLSKPTAGGT